mmetsp:Transcript_3933/g.8964  ORF Transcript_3933/g.8964 Transcript_3933/m.8964 type:complete len:230 (-) Transcript_3933:210-899(-)
MQHTSALIADSCSHRSVPTDASAIAPSVPIVPAFDCARCCFTLCRARSISGNSRLILDSAGTSNTLCTFVHTAERVKRRFASRANVAALAAAVTAVAAAASSAATADLLLGRLFNFLLGILCGPLPVAAVASAPSVVMVRTAEFRAVFAATSASTSSTAPAPAAVPPAAFLVVADPAAAVAAAVAADSANSAADSAAVPAAAAISFACRASASAAVSLFRLPYCPFCLL